MRKKIGVLCISAGLLIIAAAAVLLVYNSINDRIVAADLDKKVAVIKNNIEENAASYSLENAGEAPSITIDGNEYIGYISIPTISLESPIISEWSYKKLKTAPCRHFGSAYSGDLVIAGHNYKSGFGKLTSLKAGDKLSFTDTNGFVYNYEVASIETLSSTAVEEMKGSNFELSLYTCNYSGNARVTVRCRRVY